MTLPLCSSSDGAKRFKYKSLLCSLETLLVYDSMALDVLGDLDYMFPFLQSYCISASLSLILLMCKTVVKTRTPSLNERLQKLKSNMSSRDSALKICTNQLLTQLITLPESVWKALWLLVMVGLFDIHGDRRRFELSLKSVFSKQI